MSLNIKNEETHRLVRRLAELTGQSQTSAVEDAVRRRLDELESEGLRGARAAAISRVVERAQLVAATDPEWVATDWHDELYDESGLPR
jgi:antitoxin VapB